MCQSFQTEHGPPTIVTTQKLMYHLINRLHILFTELNLKAKPLLPSNLIGSKLIFHNPHLKMYWICIPNSYFFIAATVS